MSQINENESDVTDEQREALQMLFDDYKKAAKLYVPGYKGGGLSRKIALALILDGWRKKTNSFA